MLNIKKFICSWHEQAKPTLKQGEVMEWTLVFLKSFAGEFVFSGFAVRSADDYECI